MVDISIPKPDFEKSRGQIGIETLVVFIAMILVAALAAGVLINTAGFLQNKATATSSDSQAQVSNNVRVVSAVGIVNTGPNGETPGNASQYPNNITSINLTVMQSPGADEIDLQGATIQWVSPNGAATLVYNETATATNGEFAAHGVKDTDDSAPVLNQQEDRFNIEVELDNGSNAMNQLTPLKPGEEATMRIVTMSGAQTTYIVNVPQSLSSTQDNEAVSL